MMIKEILQLEEGTAGFSVQGKLLNAYEVKTFTGEFGEFKKQVIQIADDTERIYCRISNGFVSKSDIGKDIGIKGCLLEKYDGKLKIEAGSKSSVTIEREEVRVKKEAVSLPKKFLDIVTEALEEATLIIEHPMLADAVKKAKAIGLTSEDVRAMMISRMIEKSRGR